MITTAQNDHVLDIHSYDFYVIAFSGGKDSVASFLRLLESGVPREKIELWHHEIDGRGETFMDWEVTPSYCRAFAKYFGVPIYFSWKQGGFLKELLREKERTAPTIFEDELHNWNTIHGSGGKLGTRLRFPQISADLTVRWCSPYLKIGVCDIALRNQPRFIGKRTLVVSGERGEESPSRARYNSFEPDRADLRFGVKYRRCIDRWRPVLHYREQDVWSLIKKYSIRVHPAYYMGWGRVSCKYCIFGSCNQFASAFQISPRQGKRIITLEKKFNITIKRDSCLEDVIARGKPYEAITDELAKIATSANYDLPIFMKKWVLPAGAYGESCGPS